MKNIFKKLRLSTLVAFGLILVLLPIILITLYKPGSAEAEWYSENFQYRKEIVITSTNGSTQTDVYVAFDGADVLDTSGTGFNADCSDLRFTNREGKLLKHIVNSGCDSSSTDVDVLFPSFIDGEQSIFMYYGNPSAADIASPVAFQTEASNYTIGTEPASPETGPGPVAYWKFDEGVDNTCANGTDDVCDNSSQGNDGYITNDVAWQTEDLCMSGKCVFFDGSGDDITLQADSFDNLSAGTISAWINPTNTGTIFSQASSSSSNDLFQFRLTDCSTACKVSVHSRPTSEDEVRSVTTFSTNEWHHVVATSDGSTWKIYIDGVQSSLSVFVGSNSGDWFADSVSGTDNYTIGVTARSIGDIEYFNGKIDEVKIYNYARSAAQIKADFNARGASQGVAASFGGGDQSFLSDGLVGYWKMDETSGNASDSSGNGTTLTNVSTTAFSAAKFGRGAEPDGTADYFDAVDNATLSLTGDVTLAAWIEPDDVTGDQVVLGKFDDADESYLLTLTSDELRMYVDSSSNYETTDAANLAGTTKYHVAGVYDSSTATVKLFVNGELEASTTTGTIPSSIGDDTGEFTIGAEDSGGTPANFFDGHIDEARVYNRAFSPAEVQSLYNWAPGPVAHYKLDENLGTSTTYDSSGNGTNGTLTSITSEAWVPGQYGSALELDGSADYVDVGTGPTQVRTIEFWVYPETDTEYFVNLTSTTDYISASSGTIDMTGDASETIYVNGIPSTTLTANTWQHVAVVTSADENASNLDIGRTADANYLQGKIDDIRLYDYVRTSGQIVEDMNGGHPLGGSPVGSQVVYYGFDEGYGTTANNQINAQSSVTGSISGATWDTQTNCKTDRCLDYDGTDDVTTVTNADPIDMDVGLSSGFSISTWFNADTDGEADTGQIFQKGTSTYCRTDSESGGNVDIECNLDLATTDANVNISGISANAWHHLVLTYDDASKITVYIDGIYRGEDTGSGATASDANDLLIGGTTTANFDGSIDEFKVYSAELTAEQVMIDYNAGASINFGTGAATSEADEFSMPDPVGYWDFNEKTGTSTVNDKGSGQNNGTLTSITEDSWTQGKKGGALSLDGSADFVDVGTGPTDVNSVSFWVYPETTTEYFVNLTSTTDYIAASSGTLTPTGFTSPTVYVDGVNQGATGTIVADKWQHVAITSATSENASNLDIGRTADANYLEGKIDEVKLFAEELTQAQVAYEYNRGRPVAHWQFDECQGAVAYDASGNGYNGTITIGASGTNTSAGTCSGSAGEAWADGATGKINSSLEFDDNDDTVIGSPNMISAYPFSVSAWIKTTDSLSDIFMLADADQTTEQSLRIVSSKVRATSQISASSNNAISTTSVDDGNWHFLTGVWSSTTSRSIYVDGVLEDTDTNSKAFDAGIDNWCIGTDCSNSLTSSSHTGLIDDVRVYNYALSAAQIRKIMNDGSVARFGPDTGSP